MEIECARLSAIPIYAVINGDKFIEREVISQYQTLGYGFLFKWAYARVRDYVTV